MKQNEKFFDAELLNKNKCLFKFFILFFIKSKLGPIIGISLSLFFMIFFYTVSKSQPDMTTFANGLPAFISVSILPLCLISIPQLMVELKNSILLRRIKNSGFSKTNYVGLIFLFFLIAVIIFTLSVFIIFFSILNHDAHKYMSVDKVYYGELIYALLALITNSMMVGIFLGSIIKNISITFLIGVSFLLITLIFSGQFIPIQVIGNIDAIKYLGLFSPLNYSSALLNNVLIEDILGQGKSIFSIDYFEICTQFSSDGPGCGETMIIYDSWQKILNLVMPFILSIALFFLSHRYFSWYGR